MPPSNCQQSPGARKGQEINKGKEKKKNFNQFRDWTELSVQVNLQSASILNALQLNTLSLTTLNDITIIRLSAIASSFDIWELEHGSERGWEGIGKY